MNIHALRKKIVEKLELTEDVELLRIVADMIEYGIGKQPTGRISIE